MKGTMLNAGVWRCRWESFNHRPPEGHFMVEIPTKVTRSALQYKTQSTRRWSNYPHFTLVKSLHHWQASFLRKNYSLSFEGKVSLNICRMSILFWNEAIYPDLSHLTVRIMARICWRSGRRRKPITTKTTRLINARKNGKNVSHRASIN